LIPVENELFHAYGMRIIASRQPSVLLKLPTVTSYDYNTGKMENRNIERLSTD